MVLVFSKPLGLWFPLSPYQKYQNKVRLLKQEITQLKVKKNNKNKENKNKNGRDLRVNL